MNAELPKFRMQISCDADALEGANDVIALIASRCDLSRAQIKAAMTAGALWLQEVRGGERSRPRRIRRRSAGLKVGDTLYFYYDARQLSSIPLVPNLVDDLGSVTIWKKPAGMRVEGSKWGDHLSMLRAVEAQLGNRSAFPVHRLDQWTAGLIAIAHDRQAAAVLASAFARRQVTKRYRALVPQKLERTLPYSISVEIDGKPALTKVLSQGPANDWLCAPESKASYSEFSSVSRDTVEIHELYLEIGTGRTHQIRRHLAAINLPILGDRHQLDALEAFPPVCSQVDLQLVACELGFDWCGSYRSWKL